MMDVSVKPPKAKSSSELLRKEISSRANARAIAGMPAFSIEAALPEELKRLLTQMEDAEDEQSPKRSH